MAPGEYAVHILCDNEDIPKSPFIANIVPSTDFYPDKVINNTNEHCIDASILGKNGCKTEQTLETLCGDIHRFQKLSKNDIFFRINCIEQRFDSIHLKCILNMITVIITLSFLYWYCMNLSKVSGTYFCDGRQL